MKILYTLGLFLFFSCTTQVKEIEYVEFEHECIMRIKSDKIIVRILPSTKKSKKQRTVELNYEGKSFLRKPISENEYQQIILAIKNIEEEDSHIDNNGIETMILDGGQNTITYRKGNVNITHTSRSLSKDWYPSFHNASNIITKAAGLNFSHIH